MKIDIKGTEEIDILIIVTGSKVGAKLGITELMKIFMVEMEKIDADGTHYGWKIQK